MLKSHQRFRSETHNIFTGKINKTALSNDDDKRLETFDGVASYPYGWKNVQNRIVKIRKYKKLKHRRYHIKMDNFYYYITGEKKTKHNPD